MPNWCSTSYTLVGTRKNVGAAFRALRKLEQTPRSKEAGPDSFLPDSRWLGYVATDILGIPCNDIDCRGDFSQLELEMQNGRHCICFFTETAWGPCTDLWLRFCRKFHLSLNYIAEEPGCLVYEKLNPDGMYSDNYVYDDDEAGRDYFATLDDFIAMYGEKLGIKPGASYEEVADFLENNTENRLFQFDGCDDPARPA